VRKLLAKPVFRHVLGNVLEAELSVQLRLAVPSLTAAVLRLLPASVELPISAGLGPAWA
jgi:hypothetical protein